MTPPTHQPITHLWASTPAHKSHAFSLRQTVFVEEQGFDEEFDDIDDVARHLILYDGETPVATARMFEEHQSWHIGRVCVLPAYRGQGLGALLMQICVQKAMELAPELPIRLGAQVQAQGFYEKIGFEASGDPYEEEGCPHQPMQYRIHKEE